MLTSVTQQTWCINVSNIMKPFFLQFTVQMTKNFNPWAELQKTKQKQNPAECSKQIRNLYDIDHQVKSSADRQADSPRGRGGCQRRRKGRGSSGLALSVAWAGFWLRPPLCPILCRKDKVTTQLKHSTRKGGRITNASKVWLWLFCLPTKTKNLLPGLLFDLGWVSQRRWCFSSFGFILSFSLKLGWILNQTNRT